MAATWIKPLHVNKGKTIAQTISDRTDYVKNPDKTIAQVITGQTDYIKNPDKTHKGELVVGYGCNPRTADEEFLLAKREYEYLTGRNQGRHNILAYHIRQSFKPDEITPQEAQEVGYELAMRFTKGKHAFIVAVHTDKKHVHCHIVFNSTRLDCKGKFNNFFRSTFAIRRLSDLICAEHGLSIIENPKPSKGENYAEWLGNKEPSWQEKLRRKIDEVLPSCSTFEDFLKIMKAAGYTVNDKRKHITFLAPGQTKPTRLNTLKGDYTEAAIRERIANGTKVITTSGNERSDVPKPVLTPERNSTYTRVNLLINIQAKIREGKGAGYEQWARIFNLKEAAKTLLFLKENGIDSYDDLVKKSSAASSEFSALSSKIKDADKRLAEITLHLAAKKHFDELGYGKDKKLPTIASLKQEYAVLFAEKKKLYSGYRDAKANMQELLIAKGNADKILGVKPETQKHEASRSQSKHNTHEI